MSDRLIQKLDRLYQTHRDRMYLCALSVTGRADLAEDAVHEAYVKLFRLAQPPRHLRAYVFRAIRNAAVDQVRRCGNGKPTAADLTVLYAPPDRSSELAELNQQLIRAIAGLDADRREVVVLRLNAGLRFREIARVLGLPLGTVASRYRRGVEDLRRVLKESGHG